MRVRTVVVAPGSGLVWLCLVVVGLRACFEARGLSGVKSEFCCYCCCSTDDDHAGIICDAAAVGGMPQGVQERIPGASPLWRSGYKPYNNLRLGCDLM